MLARFGARYLHVESGDNAYMLRGRDRSRPFGSGSMSAKLRKRRRR